MAISTVTGGHQLTALSACEQARAVAAREVSAAALVEAHVDRILAIDGKLNAVVVRRFDEARAEARQVDAALARGEQLGPLAGVPITIKECFHVAGTPATMGIHRFAHELSKTDSPLVARLRRAGAIVLGKTNVPQLMLMHETDNPLYGRTNNPWNLDRSPGGSSGGEAAIIAAGGSPLGLGNDLGGSIRQPAHSCGICGLKPTTLRLTNAGVRRNLHGFEAIRSQAGPLARTVADLALAMRILATVEEGRLETDTVPAPLRDPNAVRVESLRIGVWIDDGYFAPSPAIARGVREAAAELEQRGATMVPFEPVDMRSAVRLYMGLLSADGAADAQRSLDDSPRDWRMERLVAMGKTTKWLRRAWIAGLRASGQTRTAEILDATGPRTADEYWQLIDARAQWAERFAAAWQAAELDAILCPPHALVALRHAKSVRLAAAASYCYWANLLGVPAGVVPITRVRSGEESERPASPDRVEQSAAAVEAGSVGLPVAVQIAARPFREDVVLAVMGALEAACRSNPGFPTTPVFRQTQSP